MIAFRSQIRKKTPKHRVILVSPGPVAIVEKMFAYPLQEAMERAPFPRPWATGWDWFKSGGMNVADYIESKQTLSLDFESFDQSPPPFLIRRVFNVIKNCFEMDREQQRVFHGIVESHCSSSAVLPGQQRTFHLTGGVRTGSSFTHVLGTILCMTMIKYLAGDAQSISYGDDTMLITDIKLRDLACLCESISSFKISVSKSKRGVQWLGFTWNGDRWVCENPDRRWAQFFFPERDNRKLYCEPEARLQAMLLSCLSDPMRHRIRAALIELKSEVVTPHTSMLLAGRRIDISDYVGQNVFDVELAFKRHHRLD